MVFRSALRPFKAMFRLKASMSRVLLLLDFDHRHRIQFFRAREYAFRVQGAAITKTKILYPLIASERLGFFFSKKNQGQVVSGGNEKVALGDYY